MSEEPACRACAAQAIIDTGHPTFPFMCLVCGCWGDRPDEVDQELDDET